MTDVAVSKTHPVHLAPCRQCRRTFDLISAELCGCVARERTFACPHCGKCACDAGIRERNAFWFAAPVALRSRRRAEQDAVEVRLQSLDPRSLPRPFAVIVDDDPLVLAVADRALRAMGFNTLANSNPEAALAITTAIVPDLLLTDALMPRLDGRQLCLRLKEDSRTQGIKVIVMSALYRGIAYRNEAFKSFQVDEYLEKPLKPAVLRDAVHRLMPEVARQHEHVQSAGAGVS